MGASESVEQFSDRVSRELSCPAYSYFVQELHKLEFLVRKYAYVDENGKERGGFAGTELDVKYTWVVHDASGPKPGRETRAEPEVMHHGQLKGCGGR
jgi:hypothetical protein